MKAKDFAVKKIIAISKAINIAEMFDIDHAMYQEYPLFYVLFLLNCS